MEQVSLCNAGFRVPAELQTSQLECLREGFLSPDAPTHPVPRKKLCGYNWPQTSYLLSVWFSEPVFWDGSTQWLTPWILTQHSTPTTCQALGSFGERAVMNTESFPQAGHRQMQRPTQASRAKLTLVFGQAHSWHLTQVPQSVNINVQTGPSLSPTSPFHRDSHSLRSLTALLRFQLSLQFDVSLGKQFLC